MTLIRDDGLRRRMATGGNAFVRREFDPMRFRATGRSCSPTRGGSETRFILPPLRATWKRWQKLSSTRYSLLRAWNMSVFRGCVFRGACLTLARRIKFISSTPHVDGTIDGVNLSANEKPAIVADLNGRCP